jgi:transposase
VVLEVGGDMPRFPSDKHFASWMGLCPGTRITGGKVLCGKTKRCANRAAQALRLAAAAHKLARLICAMLTKGKEYTDHGRTTTRSTTAHACCINWPSAPRSSA